VFRSRHSEWSGRAPLAVNLGTSRTEVFAPKRGLLIGEPTVLAWDRSGQAFAAGREAWEAWEAWEASVSTGARLSCPVRRALPVGPINCVRYLSLLFKQYRLRVDGPVVLAIPAVGRVPRRGV
jgi:hypothetical protein